MAFKLALDAGHGLKTLGKRCDKKIDPNQTREWWLNNRIAVYMEEYLKPYEVDILRVDDRTGAKDISLSNRAKAANNFGADVYFSVHHNAATVLFSGGGIVVYVWKKANAELLEQQKIFYNNLIAETGLKGNRANPLGKANFTVLVKTNMPAILVEHGFMNSTVDTPIILTDDFACKCAKANVKSLVEIYGLKKKEAEPPKEPEKEPEKVSTVNENDVVSIVSGATYYSGKNIPSWVKAKQWIIASINGDRAVLGKSTDGKNNIQSAINTKYLTVVKTTKEETTKLPYKVKVTEKDLIIRQGAGTNTKKCGTIPVGVYTIVEERNGTGAPKWGKLKSGAGWIPLDCVTVV